MSIMKKLKQWAVDRVIRLGVWLIDRTTTPEHLRTDAGAPARRQPGGEISQPVPDTKTPNQLAEEILEAVFAARRAEKKKEWDALVSGWQIGMRLNREQLAEIMEKTTQLREAAAETEIAQPVPDTVATSRAGFAQWPPAPDEVTPGVGGGVTRGVQAHHVAQLGRLWVSANCPGFECVGKRSETEHGNEAAQWVAAKYGWADITRGADLDPDQFYLARHMLQRWVETGKEPEWPAPPSPPTP